MYNVVMAPSELCTLSENNGLSSSRRCRPVAAIKSFSSPRCKSPSSRKSLDLKVARTGQSCAHCLSLYCPTAGCRPARARARPHRGGGRLPGRGRGRAGRARPGSHRHFVKSRYDVRSRGRGSKPSEFSPFASRVRGKKLGHWEAVSLGIH